MKKGPISQEIGPFLALTPRSKRSAKLFYVLFRLPVASHQITIPGRIIKTVAHKNLKNSICNIVVT
jgi:hypothetical protein